MARRKTSEMQVIKNIIFDFGGVLVDLDRRKCIDAFLRIGAGAIAGYVDECRQEDLFHDLEVGNIGVAEFCEAVRRACPGCTATDADICDAWNALLAGIPRYRLERLAALRGEYRLALLSNTNPIHWSKSVSDYFTQCGLTVNDYFGNIYLSYEMHMLKPDAEIFRKVLDDSGMNAGETLFIDDSAANCEGAKRLGINVMHIDFSGKESSTCKPAGIQTDNVYAPIWQL